MSEPDKQVAQVATIDADVLRTAAQRKINSIWEITQALIALSVTITTLGTCAYLVTHADKDNSAMGAFLLLSNVFFLVVGTYFQRTNHTKTAQVQDEHR